MVLFGDMLYMLVIYIYIYIYIYICESKRSYVLEVADVVFIRPCGVVVLTLF